MRIVDERLESFFLERAVEEGQARRNRIVEDDSTDRCVDYATHILLHSSAQDVLRIVFLRQVD